ncbi:isoleucine--tRNA ligase, mitochondrial-like [Physella acuta]|uniref:isoleucine--tRNA ligase, mitochondrial-like n=1 Tax=Physella acuta TaxID=109671 RepID=UPI0027DC8ACC|nr:isoleucine--tRNA ligase, mitochondrial-like [Physella acuta]
MNRIVKQVFASYYLKPKTFYRYKSDHLNSDSGTSSKTKGKKSKRYSHTLNLPVTSFPLSMKSGAAPQRELEIQQSDSFKTLYQWQRKQKWDTEFILHDGPPYANGKPHVGHVVNKVLKDITNRYKVLKKYKVHYRPGWDCHGMPIEIKAITDKTGKPIQLSPLEIRAKSKKFAERVVLEQKKAFQQWGVMGDWENIYKTLAPEYEAKQLEVFYEIYKKGNIYRDYMPVYWSPSSQSALAEAELEYNPVHVSKSVYVKFLSIMPQFSGELGEGSQVSAVVWTTTPWTLPFNQAVCYSPKIKYAFLRVGDGPEVYLCEESFVESLMKIVPVNLELIFSVEGSLLQGSTYLHPLSNKQLPFLQSGHVVEGKGTGLVHIAPAHGHDDFYVALTHNLPKECHIDEKGTYVSGCDASLIGKTVGVNANEAVISALGPRLMKCEDYTHNYPYDWRTKKPVIIRASKQWFVDLRALRPLALESLSSVSIIPQQSERGMITELNTRPYWCISRQRTWGVPMPIFYHKQTDEPLITGETVDHLKKMMLKHGSDCWWSMSVEELLPNSLLAKLNKGVSSDYVKGQDILDIWFDSGVSWASILQDYGGLADVYMEGIDQYKGWFQTSLLTSVAVKGRAPYKQIITHGFTTDEEGKKMSKSLGNVVDPEKVIFGGKDKKTEPAYGVDVLRWWVAHSHHHQHIMIGPSILEKFHEDVFKVRKCIRHILGNLHNFNPETDLVAYSSLTAFDKYLLYVLHTSLIEIENAYESISYHKITQILEKFFYSDLSSFYISNTHDRCYCNAPKDLGRRSSQTVQYYVARAMTSAFAPILPHLAEEIHQHIPGYQASSSEADSVFKLAWFHPKPEWNNKCAVTKLMPVFDMRRAVMDKLCLESPVEFDIHIYSSPKLHDLLREIQPDVTSCTSCLCEVFQTSQVSVLDVPPAIIPEDSLMVEGSTLVQLKESEQAVDVDFKILVVPATLHMCERCRRYTAKSSNTPCERCLDVIAQHWDT